MFKSRKFKLSVLGGAIAALGMSGSLLNAAEDMEEIVIVGTTPGTGLGQEVNKIPFAVQAVSADDLQNAQSLDVSDYLNRKVGSINLNAAQNNPLQPDLQFRGFTASPLLGLAQGIAVYQNGVRINEPLGDSVNWDLLPESAISSIAMIGGADPLFGLNTLGGALVLNMKDGFDFRGQQMEVSGGSWGRVQTSLESGGNNGTWGYYVNLSTFEEDGWRQLSDSEALNFYGSLAWREGETSAVNLNYQNGLSDLTGNGTAPVGLLALQRDAVFTAPDITENDMEMWTLDGSHFINSNVQISGTAFWRENHTDSFNGDASEFELCDYGGGGPVLLEEADEVEDLLEDELGIALDELCEGEGDIGIFATLGSYIENRALAAGLDPEDFELEDVTEDLSGTGVLSDEAINNISKRQQESKGVEGKLLFLNDLFQKENRLTVGFSYYQGQSRFDSVVELSGLDPITRSTQGLGTGTFYDEGETRVNTETETWSLYFTDTISVSERVFLTFSGRYNSTDISLRDRSGERPELNGDHKFNRFNPTVGINFSASENLHLYASYSESNRVPTPIELACNEGVFELARSFAEAAGEDPEDIDFECRLPNAFLADPPLEDVVTKGVELGMRGEYGQINYQLGLFHADNRDDILFQSTGRSTGLFANVDLTRRQGFEASLNGSGEQLDWYASYSYTEASFQDNFLALSPNHPFADEEGNIQVRSGDRMPGVPRALFKLGGDFHLSSSISLGAELLYNGSQVMRGDESNQLEGVDDFVLLNLRASYALGETLSFFARVSNVLDEKYESYGLLGEGPEELLPGLKDQRPLYLGAGAPRAAWAGFRIRL